MFAFYVSATHAIQLTAHDVVFTVDFGTALSLAACMSASLLGAANRCLQDRRWVWCWFGAREVGAGWL